MEAKIHLYHSHIIREIYGYVHSFCNLKVKENKHFFSLFAHNLFRFDIFFFVNGVRLCVWQTKSFSIRIKNLKYINFANIGDQVKFIDKMKDYQQSLSGLAVTTSEEKSAIKTLSKKFLTEHNYFSNNWPWTDIKSWREIIELLSSGKGVIPYKN